MATRSRPILLLDVDGVLLDFAGYDREWARLADAALAPLFGARNGGWAELRRATWSEVLEREGNALWKLSAAERPAPDAFWSDLHGKWIDRLCRAAAVEAPPTPAERARLGQRALDAYFRNTRAVVPGARAAIEQLSARFELHMASGNPACVVESVLEGIGVRGCVGLPFGSDLACAFKEDSERFYRAILDRLGARAADVWVVDDRDYNLLVARELGARTIKIGASSEGARHDVVVDSLPEVVAALAARDER
jgi:FMN phosphatase YigB (HAD superfamily)